MLAERLSRLMGGGRWQSSRSIPTATLSSPMHAVPKREAAWPPFSTPYCKNSFWWWITTEVVATTKTRLRIRPVFPGQAIQFLEWKKKKFYSLSLRLKQNFSGFTKIWVSPPRLNLTISFAKPCLAAPLLISAETEWMLETGCDLHH